MGGPLHNLTGRRFGRLVVLRRSPRRRSDAGNRATYWECVCDCGVMKTIGASPLVRGHTRSCGCFLAESVRDRSIRHGLEGTYIYSIWRGMLARCLCQTGRGYKDYGGRGITVCERWKNSVTDFVDDMGPRPSPAHSIDRINVNGNYEPGNCRWATRSQQQRNRRCNPVIVIDGIKMLLVEASEKYRIHSKTALDRMQKFGWSAEKAFKTPLLRKKKCDAKCFLT